MGIRYYVGIDLHSNNLVLCVMDQDGNILFRRRLANDLVLVLCVLEQYRAQLDAIVVESTFNWYWLVDGLEDAGFHVILANPAAMQQYTGLKYTDDKSDAAWLANCLRLGLLEKAQGYIYPREQRQIRDLLRKRGQMVHQSTANILSIQNLISRNTGSRISGNDVKKLSDEEVCRKFPEFHLAMPILANLHIIQALQKEIAVLEGEVSKQVASDEPFELLKSVCGIGRILAMAIYLESGDINRFASVGNYSSYCRCVESKRTSNNKLKGRGNRKNGNKYLAWAYMEAAHFAIRHYEEVRSYYQRKQSKSKKVVALKAIAHKLARASYWVMKKGEPFDMRRAFE